MGKFSRMLTKYLLIGAGAGAVLGSTGEVLKFSMLTTNAELDGPKKVAEWQKFRAEYADTINQLRKSGVQVVPQEGARTTTTSQPMKLRVVLDDGQSVFPLFDGPMTVTNLEKYLETHATNISPSLKSRIMAVEQKYPSIIKHYDAHVKNEVARLSARNPFRSAAYAAGVGALVGAGIAANRRRKELKSRRISRRL